MRELTVPLARWHEAGMSYALATVVGVTGSAPRPVGATMAVNVAGEVAGSLSGGCVESAVYELCLEVLESGAVIRETFGYNDSDAFSVGLTCGGRMEVLVHVVRPPQFAIIEAVLDARAPAAFVRDMRTGVMWVVDAEEGGAAGDASITTDGNAAEGRDVGADEEGGIMRSREAGGVESADRCGGSGVSERAAWDGVDARGGGGTRDGGGEGDRLGGGPGDGAAAAQARAMLELGRSGVRVVGCGLEEVTVFVQSFVPPPRMIIFGATDFAAALCRVGRLLGYRVTVCDARPAFLDAARMPDADEIVVAWPHRYLQGTQVDSRTVVCVLTHDPKFDIPVLTTALRLPVAYVGALGARRVDAARRTRLRAAGISEDELSRLRSPIGLQLGGRTPEETAVAIGAEIVASRYGGSAEPLSQTGRPIHASGSPSSVPSSRSISARASA